MEGNFVFSIHLATEHACSMKLESYTRGNPCEPDYIQINHDRFRIYVEILAVADKLMHPDKTIDFFFH